MPTKLPVKQKLTDDERHKRFVDMAKEVGASNEPTDFDRAFARIVEIKETEAKRGSKK